MFAGNLQTYQHSRWSLKWIRNSSCCESERKCPGDPQRDKKNIIRQVCSKTRRTYLLQLTLCMCALYGVERGPVPVRGGQSACV